MGSSRAHAARVETRSKAPLAASSACSSAPRMMELHISGAGICAATPHVTELKITWNGSRTKPRDLKVKTKESREWTKEDRQKHKEYIKNVEIRKMNFGFRDL